MTAAPLADAPTAAAKTLQERIDAACATACAAIAPAWPLDQAIAVNPHWQRVSLPVRRVAARMAVLGEIRVFPPRAQLRADYAHGRITEADLALAIRQLPAAQMALLTPARCREALAQDLRLARLPLLIDVLDDDPERHTRLSWRAAITHQVSQTCAAYFDAHQADWQPERHGGLYAFWRETLTHDHGIGVLMGLPAIEKSLAALPATRADAEIWALQRLGLPEDSWSDYLEAVLLTVNGWASWCAYQGWQAALEGGTDGHLRDLLAIRLAWGAVLLECKDDLSARQAFATLQARWRRAPTVLKEAEDALLIDEVWQTALEIGYQRGLAAHLTNAVPSHSGTRPTVQAAFCIDVRSEPMRRALEAALPGIETVGFAGFFGLPIAYTPLATDARRPQLPGLLAPALEVSECPQPAPGSAALRAADVAQARQQRFATAATWRATTRWPGTAFSFVEAAGVGYLGALARWLRPGKAARHNDDLAGLTAAQRSQCRPILMGLDVAAKAGVAAKVLHAMGLEQGLAPLVLLVGHGSQSQNNAHAAALDCGACCGQTGEVNARALAQLLNDAEVRRLLAEQRVVIPADTWFVAALHNTTTDEIEGFDLDLLPAETQARWKGLQPALQAAGDQVRRERAPTLGLDPKTPASQLFNAFRRRANDGAQTRPEWALAGNAAFVIGPRARTRAANLAGRSFLHDYDEAKDPDGSVLELLMTAPMLVTHWINWQYHASTCDPERLGSGNKVLHNVVGGRIGVFEGNGGDLRIGLSRQSLFDGQRWVHEPLRLTVVIDASAAAIERIIHAHAIVRQLLDNGWLHLWRYDGAQLQRYAQGHWQALGLNSPSKGSA